MKITLIGVLAISLAGCSELVSIGEGAVQLAEVAVDVSVGLLAAAGVVALNIAQDNDIWTVQATDTSGALVVNSSMALDGQLPTPSCSDAAPRFQSAVNDFMQCQAGDCETQRRDMHLVATEVVRCRQ
jgi:hypothetical protein